MTEKTLYERLGGIYSIAAVTDYFVDALAENPLIGVNTSNQYLKDWYANRAWRKAGFKVLNTIWVCEKAGGPERYVSTVPNGGGLNLEPTHYVMKLTDKEFEAAGKTLFDTLDHFDVPEKEKQEVIDAFIAHRNQVVNSSVE